MRIEGFLPIGSVVLLKEGEHRLMITGYAQKLEGKEGIYDYVGCLWPEGFMKADQNVVFNHDMIDTVYFLGLQTDGQMVFMQKMQNALETLKNNK